MIKAKFRTKSLYRVAKTVEEVLDQVERRGMKDALMKSATPMVKKTKELAPKGDTGALRASIGKRGTTDAQNQSAAVSIGPRRKFKKNGRSPGRYAHLVEFGHQLVKVSSRGRRRVGFVAPRPFMRPAFESTTGESRRIYGRELSAAILRHFKRAKKSGKV